MSKRIIGAVLSASLAIAALGAPALAEAERNDHNCVGANASSFKSSMGSFASLVKAKGQMDEFNHEYREAFCS